MKQKKSKKSVEKKSLKPTKLKMCIEEKGLKQKWVGIQAGIAETDFSKIASGKKHANSTQMKKIAKVLNVKTSKIF